MNRIFKAWFKKAFLRDMRITKKGFIYFLVAFTFAFATLINLVISISTLNIGLNIEEMFNTGAIPVIVLILSLIISGYIVDLCKNRMKLLLISGFFILFGLSLRLSEDIVLNTIGDSMTIFFFVIFILDLMTIIIHETTILNRGRLIGYLFFFSCLISIPFIFLVLINPYSILFFLIILFIILLFIYTDYSYIETTERLSSDITFKDSLKKRSLNGYLLGFLTLGFVIGNAYPLTIPISFQSIWFISFLLLFFVYIGVLLDNMGRKWSFTAGIAIIAGIVILLGVFPLEISYSIFLGVAIPTVLVQVITFAGDLSTERNTLKYRGRILGIFVLFLIIGFLGGFITAYSLSQFYFTDPNNLSWIPNLTNAINALLLISLLVWIMPLSEILSSKESDWASTLRHLYIFNRDSICLHAKNFLPDNDMIDLLPEDLVTGGLTGILTLISEITNEKKKNLRIIDKAGIKIYFSYGKSVIVALISTKYLPVLFKKLEIFTKEFERQFYKELSNFKGKINPFFNKTDILITRYFK